MNLIITKKQPKIGVSTIEIDGEIDIFSSKELKLLVASEIDNGARCIIFEMSKVGYLDSTGLALLVGAFKRLNENKGTLSIVNPSPRIVRILQVTGMNKIFDIFDTEEAALRAMEAPSS